MKYLLLFLLFLLAACAPVGAPVGTSKPVAEVDRSSLRQQLERLPGAQLQAEPLAFSYPDQVMFGTGAVLPMPGGPKLLDPLAELIKQNPGLVWQVDVRARTEHGNEYDQLLAEKRSELLASYLLSKGAELINLHFQPEANEGDPLVFTLKQQNNPTN